MTQDPPNPYAPPAASVQDRHQAPEASSFIPGGRTLPAGRGSTWLGSAWQLFREQAMNWILIWVLFIILFCIAALLPMGTYLLPPILTGGIMLGCERLRTSGQLEVGDLFSGFRKHTGPLLIQGLLYLGGAFIAAIPSIILMVIGFIMMLPELHDGDVGMAGVVVLIIAALVMLALFFPLMAAIWFAPPLIVLNDVLPLDALKQSFRACLKNWLPLTIYSLLLLLLGCAGLVTCCLGFLVIGPLFSISVYTSYRDIFFEDPAL